MASHTSFRCCLDPSVEQERVLSRHVGAARFGFNQALHLHKEARHAAHRRESPGLGVGSDGGHSEDDAVPGVARVPRTGFDLITAFNAWKRSEAAGRRFVVDANGSARVEVTGLVWRDQVVAQVFEEAAVDLGRALKAHHDSRTGARKGPTVGFPRFKKKTPTGGSFRIRNKATTGRRAGIRLGDGDRPRSVSLPKIGVLRVREDTRRLRRMVAKGRARVLFVTVSRGANQQEDAGRAAGWVGVDRGLHALAVAGTSDGVEDLRVSNQRALRRGLPQLRRLSKAVSRKKKESKNRRRAVVRLSRQHARIRDRRCHVLPVVNAHRQDTPIHDGPHGRGGKGLDDVGTSRPHTRSDWTPEKGGVSQGTQLLKHAVGCPP